jgi:hypothetical protein
MRWVVVGKRSQNGEPIGQRCKLCKMLADLYARHGGRNRTKFASNLGGRIGFQIERIELARSTPHEDKNAPLSPDGQRAGLIASNGTKRRERSEPQERQSPSLEHLPAVALKNSAEIGTVR